ncbi:HAMP domain-containing histidine kinase [Solihabitans fulvus]|uniref:histidine kinase n=1 Tax=Solihabitans fulvus TaxID=1892852 RepID=A0A5B2WVH2_9PSEU|nr:HAMP domain-containing sensor histidine kinase [Solihabitans fulvus]KAA2254904.1 HAMP domain-containing histidine kinase [Solihabitans fulvus]
MTEQPVRARRTWTLRARLVAALLVLATIGLAGFAVASALLIQHSLYAKVDEQLRAPEVTRFLRQPPQTGSSGRHLPTDFRVAFFTSYGTKFDSQPAGDTGGPAWPTIDESTVAKQGAPFTVADQNGGADWRVRVTAASNGTLIATAVSLERTDDTIRQLLVIESVVGAFVLVLIGSVAYYVVRIGMRPLTRIEDTAEAIAGGELDRRVEDSDPRTETGRLGRALNTMLSRLGAALRERQRSEARLRRFVADASHELRTPLTSIRGFAELYRSGGAPERADVDRMMERIESEAKRMGLLVEDLLMLARLDQERALDLAEVDLVVLAGDAVHDATVRDPDRPISLHTPQGPVRVIGDEHRLRQVLTNLVGNALTHTPPGTPVQVTVGRQHASARNGEPIATAGVPPRQSGDLAVLEVRDSGAGIPVEEAPHVFDRFYRADPARSRKRGGAGLGLAITAAILEAHNGCVELLSDPTNGTVFRVLLPIT